VMATSSGILDDTKIVGNWCSSHKRNSSMACHVRSIQLELSINAPKPSFFLKSLACGHWKSMCLVSSTRPHQSHIEGIGNWLLHAYLPGQLDMVLFPALASKDKI
jgi:hypothetical protein